MLSRKRMTTDYKYLVVFFHLLNIVNKLDEPLAPLSQVPVLLAKVFLKLCKHLVQLGHILCDHGQSQGEEPQNEEVLKCHFVTLYQV